MDKRYNTLYRCAFYSNPISQQEICEIKELYKDEGRERIEESVRNRKFVPFVSNLLIDLGYHDEGWEILRDCYSKRNMRVIIALEKLYEAFDTLGADRVVVVENFGAFLAAGAEPIWRFGSGDIDLYADIKQKPEIYRAAEMAGYKYKERYSGNNLISTSFINEEELPRDFYIDIGWYPTARLKIPLLDYKEEAVDWSKTRFFKNTRIRLPDKDSLLYICMLHISVHNFSRQPDYRLYIDIQNALSGVDVDWDKISKWAIRDGYTNRIATVAYLTRELVGIDIPDRIVNLCDTKNHKRLLEYVYDSKSKVLLSKPGVLGSLRIEMLANDKSVLHGLIEIVFPKRAWLSQSYSSNLILAYFKYIIGLFR